MGCGCGQSSSSQTNAAATTYKQLSIPQLDECDITLAMLQKYLAIIQCLRTSGKSMSVGLTSFNLNQLQGIIQSAINYPDNYCYYSVQLTEFKNTQLPNIIANVPECVSQ